MENPAVAANAEYQTPPPMQSPGREHRLECASRDYLSFLDRLDDERAQLSRALEAFRVELAGAG